MIMPEDEGNMLLWNILSSLHNHTVSHLRPIECSLYEVCCIKMYSSKQWHCTGTECRDSWCVTETVTAWTVIVTMEKCVAGLTEFLLDRRIESNKICKDSKFEVVKTIAESPTAATTFGNVTLLRFREFVREGPFYVQAQSEVAVEGASWSGTVVCVCVRACVLAGKCTVYTADIYLLSLPSPATACGFLDSAIKTRRCLCISLHIESCVLQVVLAAGMSGTTALLRQFPR